MPSPTAKIALFFKYPRAGEVKTRLGKQVGFDHAADLYRFFVSGFLEHVQDRFNFSFWHPNPSDDPLIKDWLKVPELRHQCKGDLGDKLIHCFETLFQDDDHVIIIGSDSPDLPQSILQAALTALVSHEAVIGPSVDGGYYLIGFRKASFSPYFFQNILWSTDKVYLETIQKFLKKSVTYYVLPVWYDVDNVTDLLCLTYRIRGEEVLPELKAILQNNLLVYNTRMLENFVENVNSLSFGSVVEKTPLLKANKLSNRLGTSILLKREDLQCVHSFKIRGAFHKVSGLSEQAKQKGIIASSAGNHAQGVAFTAQQLGLSATIVMPVTTPDIKVEAVRSYGGKVVLFGDSYDEAFAKAKELEKELQLTFIHPYDDEEVIIGQGTIAREIVDQTDLSQVEAVFIPVGGGGLISGIGAYLKQVAPHIKIIGVEPENSDCLYQALAGKKRVVLDSVGIFADGVAVRQIGELPFVYCSTVVDAVIRVSTDEICAAIKDIYDDMRCIVEPAGALSVAGIKQYLKDNKTGKTLIGINSGANINFDRLRHIAERAEIGENKEAIFAVTIPEQPGSFLTFCKLMGKRAITEFNYRYADTENAHIFVGVSLTSQIDRQEIVSTLEKEGYPVLDITDNELSKIHIRHMVGGKNASANDELIYRFQFPERPGALLEFLSSMGSHWNISLFHYRNHGAAFGRVLVGLQVPVSEKEAFDTFLDQLGYRYFDESSNPACRLFF